jgi:hypothetical protein
MIWLAADFAQERKWKKAAAKKVGSRYIFLICDLEFFYSKLS